MSFSKWETKENFIKNLGLVKYEGGKTKVSGIPMCSLDDSIYLDTRIVNSIVIGSKGSGRHQLIVYPMVNSILSSGESGIICNIDNEVYESTHEMFSKDGYKVYYYDFDQAFNTNNWNPFELASYYYKKGNLDLSQELIDDIGYYLLYEYEPNSDPFWINSVINYFRGIALYSIKNNDLVDFNTIYLLHEEVRNNPKEFLDKLDKSSAEYICLSSVLNMPKDTFLSVMSVFDQRYNLFMIKENTKKMLSNNDIDLNKVFDEKTIIYIKSGEKTISSGLLPLFISQVYNCKNNNKKFDILIDNFTSYKPIQNISKILDYSINKGICFTIFIPGFNDLEKVYGKEGRYAIEMNVRNIIYLFSNDLNTLESISKLCGIKDKDTELISTQELKIMEEFESVIITLRSYPFKTKLLPYYKMQK